MNDTQIKQLAHELTIEYVKINPAYLSDVRSNIPEIVDMIADVNKRFYEAIKDNKIFNELY